MTDKPVIAGKKSIPVELEPGTYYWCSCGLSRNQPFCDGSHCTTSFLPLEFKIEEKKTVKLCACKHTVKPPYCDGTHKKLR